LQKDRATACISRSEIKINFLMRHDLSDPSRDHFFVIGGHRFDG